MVKNMVTLGYTHIHTYWGMFLLKRAGMGSRSIHFPQAEPGKAMHKYIEREREREPFEQQPEKEQAETGLQDEQGITGKDITSGELFTLGNVMAGYHPEGHYFWRVSHTGKCKSQLNEKLHSKYYNNKKQYKN